MNKYILLIFIGLTISLGGIIYGQPPMLLWRAYDPNTVTTITGVIEGIDASSTPRGKVEGVHIMLKGDDKTLYDVRVGPNWYLTEQNVSFNKGDELEITGSLLEVQGQKRLIPSTIRINGGDLIQLRSPEGVPAWAGQG